MNTFNFVFEIACKLREGIAHLEHQPLAAVSAEQEKADRRPGHRRIAEPPQCRVGQAMISDQGIDQILVDISLVFLHSCEYLPFVNRYDNDLL